MRVLKELPHGLEDGIGVAAEASDLKILCEQAGVVERVARSGELVADLRRRPPRSSVSAAALPWFVSPQHSPAPSLRCSMLDALCAHAGKKGVQRSSTTKRGGAATCCKVKALVLTRGGQLLAVSRERWFFMLLLFLQSRIRTH